MSDINEICGKCRYGLFDAGSATGFCRLRFVTPENGTVTNKLVMHSESCFAFTPQKGTVIVEVDPLAEYVTAVESLLEELYLFSDVQFRGWETFDAVQHWRNELSRKGLMK